MKIRSSGYGGVTIRSVALACGMGMGAMSGQDATQAWVNWVEQGINCFGQGFLLWGVIQLHAGGLNKLVI